MPRPEGRIHRNSQMKQYKADDIDQFNIDYNLQTRKTMNFATSRSIWMRRIISKIVYLQCVVSISSKIVYVERK